MQSYNDLNNFSNTPVTYGTSADYVIVFGANAGNVTATQAENGYFLIYKQVPLVTFTDVSRDLLISVNTNQPVKSRGPVYAGSNDDIKVFQADEANWSITGIRSVANYNDVFANTYIGLKDSITGPVIFTFLLDDQSGNTQTYTATITAVPSTLLSYTNPITFSEDTLSTLGNLQITDTGFAFATNYTITLTPSDPSLGQIWTSSNTLANSYTMTGNKASINTQLNALRFAPGADSTTNTEIDIQLIRSYDSATVEQVMDADWNGTSHSDYSIPVSYSVAEDSQIGLTDISITDLRPDNINSNTQYTVTLNSADSSNIIFTYNSVNSSEVTISGTKSSINSIFADANTRPKLNAYNDFSGTGTITYNQVNTTNSVVQASQIPITIFVSDDPGYSLTTGYTLPVTDGGNTGNTRLIWSITEQDLSNSTYKIDFAQLTGPGGSFFVNNSNIAASSGNISGNRTTVNNTTINFVTTVANTANATLQWSATKTSVANVTTPLSGNITLTLSPAITNLKSSYGYTSNTSTAIFATTNKPAISTALTNNITLTVQSGSGYIGTNDSDASTSWVVSGTRSQIDSLLPSVRFWPNFGVAGNVTANLTLVSDGITWVSRTLNLTGTAANIPTSLTSAPVVISTSTYTPDLARFLYCNSGTIVVVGGGGGGGIGGGGAGGVQTTTATLARIPYSVTLGAGGAGAGSGANAVGSTGGTTTAFGVSAQGGLGGRNGTTGDTIAFWNNGVGGSSGSPTSNAGGAGGYNNTRAGGGGGGGGSGGSGQSGSGTGMGGAGTVINNRRYGLGGPGYKGSYSTVDIVVTNGAGGLGGAGGWSGSGYGQGQAGSAGRVSIFWSPKT